MRKEGIASCIISAMAAKRCLQKGYLAYLAYVINKDIQKAKLDTIPVVTEFLKVFLEDLVGLPPNRKLEFTIDLILGSALISQTPYRMAPSELKELKVQLQDLVDKGFNRPSVSPRGAPVLFVKKKDGSLWLCVDYRCRRPILSELLVLLNFCWILGLFVLRFEFGPRTYSVRLFILSIESFYCFVFNCYPC